VSVPVSVGPEIENCEPIAGNLGRQAYLARWMSEQWSERPVSTGTGTDTDNCLKG
jgi:hypothetical protein